MRFLTMDKAQVLALTVIISLALLSGCTQSMIASSTNQYLIDSNTIMNPNMSVDKAKLDAYLSQGSCSILVCQNASKATSSFSKWVKFMYYSARYWQWMDPSLIGGSCWLQNVTNENKNDTMTNLSKGVYYAREFGIGQGMSFADFNDANPYCNNSLRYAVKLVRSLDGVKYSFSPKSYSGAACFLDKSVIPLYILYNNGTVPDQENAADFASQMSGLGPVMIATEMNPQSSDGNIGKINNEIREIRLNCPNCMVGLSIRNGPNGTKMLNALNESGYDSLQYVDFVGFGIDSDYLVDNNDTNCGSGDHLEGLAEEASTAIRAKYGKPTFWYYVNINRSACRWSDFEERKIFWLMFNDIPEMSKNGVLGMSPEPFYSDAFFEPVENMSFMNPDLSSPSLRQSASSTWFSLCQNYYGNRNFQLFAIDTSPLGDKCGVLDFIPEKTMTYGGRQSTGDYVPLADVNYGNKEDQTYRCKACFLIYDSKDTPPFLKGIKGSFDSSHCTKPDDAIRRMEFYGELYDIDSNLLRAIAQQESGFDHCAISYLNASDASKCTGIVVHKSDIVDAAGQAGCDVNSMPDPPYDNSRQPGAPQPQYTICASGMMQTTDLPGAMYAQRGLAMPPEVKACGGASFNPFNASHSICAAAYKIAWQFLPDASSAVSNNRDIFNVSSFSDADNQNLRDALTVEFTAERYYGNPISSGSDTYVPLWSSFRPNVDKGSDCGKMNSIGQSLCCSYDNKKWNYKNQYGVCGNAKMDPVTFYSKVKGAYPKIQYGTQVLSAYMGAIDACGGCASDAYYKAMDAKIRIYAPNAQIG
jgi:hypothetical protein